VEVTFEPKDANAVIQEFADRKVYHAPMIPYPARWLHMSQKTLSGKKRRRPVVVLKILRVLKVLDVCKAALALGFKTFWCTAMGLLVCSYGMFGVQIWGFWCAVMGDCGKLGVQIWDFISH
jgi:hypothetical protein